MNNIASEFQVLERDGVELERNGRVYPIILGNKGDWSYLVTCQMFQFDLYPMELGLGFSEVSSRVCVCARSCHHMSRYRQETWRGLTEERQRVLGRSGQQKALVFAICACAGKEALNGRTCFLV